MDYLTGEGDWGILVKAGYWSGLEGVGLTGRFWVDF